MSYDGEVSYYRPQEKIVYDGKRMRKPIKRQTVDYYSNVLLYTKSRFYRPHPLNDREEIQPFAEEAIKLMPPEYSRHNSQSSVCSKFIHTSINKDRCPVFDMVWTPEGRRLITGNSMGQFTLWNGLTFNFETILQAHDSAVRAMEWSHDDKWMVTGDNDGIVKYWESNMNNVKAFKAHSEAVRGLSFSPTDLKLASCSDDVKIRVWDFARGREESVLTGHGWDVKSVDWHPTKSLLASGGKDNMIKMWDPKTSKCLATLHNHKNTVLKVSFNKNGNWLLTAGRDQSVMLFDIRTMRELQVFRGQNSIVNTVAWHPVHEEFFCSGGDGSVMYWQVGHSAPVGTINQAHDNSIWTLRWHPLGHILGSGSNDHTLKFWFRNRPGDPLKDKYNQGNRSADAIDEEVLPEAAAVSGLALADAFSSGAASIPGFGGAGNTGSKGAIPGFGSAANAASPAPRRPGPPPHNAGRGADRNLPAHITGQRGQHPPHGRPSDPARPNHLPMINLLAGPAPPGHHMQAGRGMMPPPQAMGRGMGGPQFGFRQPPQWDPRMGPPQQMVPMGQQMGQMHMQMPQHMQRPPQQPQQPPPQSQHYQAAPDPRMRR